MAVPTMQDDNDDAILYELSVVQKELLANLAASHVGVGPNAHAVLSSSMPLVAQLRALARRAHDEVRRGKQAVAEARAGLELASLELQNLQYEKRHLESEITTCRDFRSIYDTIELTDMDDFCARADEADRTADILADAHKLQLARLRFELQERKRLEAEKQALHSRRAAMQAENRERKKRLEGLEADLKDMLARSSLVTRRFVDDKKQDTGLQPGHEEQQDKDTAAAGEEQDVEMQQTSDQ
ncbi:hypothetical protein FA10DRAFT_265183 [Acaromyces ingoldii]|uniref:Fms interacting protein n=1 Tax=Acaromyces ingoldii TaxID=215250 RepID=A0A316YPW1_9BASI|nr:hypothetical protein FA10DRAFT_265183 [Acaromyces ingoldii]PWN91319.1 hypothetical protein FA10DRAFT_265183 [Acaromyces ingoldii]